MNASNRISKRVMTMNNKRNRRFAAAFAIALGVLMAAACDQGLTEVNENPNAPETVPVQNLLLKGIWDVAANQPGRGTFGQWSQMYHAENWAQHLGQPIYNDEDRYTPCPTLNANIWDEMYFALIDLNEAKALADADGDNNIWAIAEIMTVYGFMFLTDYFGDIPYQDALSLLADDAIAFPSYTPQSTIYPDLIARLVAAAARINTSAVVTFGDFDPVYQKGIWMAGGPSPTRYNSDWPCGAGIRRRSRQRGARSASQAWPGTRMWIGRASRRPRTRSTRPSFSVGGWATSG